MSDISASMPAGAASKFHPDGTVCRFPGNTFVSALDPARAESAAISEVVERLRRSSVGPRLTFLPRSSYHMTVFEGICLIDTDPALWPADLPPDATLDAANAFFEARIDRIAGLPGPLAMRPVGLVPAASSLMIGLETRGDGENQRLRAFRDRLSLALGLRKPDHDTYRFHITLAYWLDRPADEDWALERDGLSGLLCRLLPEIDLPGPDFCQFDTMHAFPPRRSVAR